MADEKTNIVIWQEKFCASENANFSSATLFLEGSQLNFLLQKKWKQVKITNMILQRPEVLCSFARNFENQAI